jgi:hypothetical protein
MYSQKDLKGSLKGNLKKKTYELNENETQHIQICGTQLMQCRTGNLPP